jgi:type IV pilus assembly protein PilF
MTTERICLAVSHFMQTTATAPVVLRTIAVLLVVTAVGGCVIDKPKRIDKAKLTQSYIDLGLGYIGNQEYQRAKNNLNKAMMLEPKSAMVQNAFGILFQLEQEYAMAEQHFVDALQYDDKFTQARNNYGAFLYERGRYTETIEQLLIGAEDAFYRGRPAIYENLGVSYLQLGQRKLALEAFDKSVSLNPTQGRALIELASMTFDARDYPMAQDYFDRYLSVRQQQQNARSLWLGIRLSRIFDRQDDEASYSMMLKNIFPDSDEQKELVQLELLRAGGGARGGI